MKLLPIDPVLHLVSYTAQYEPAFLLLHLIGGH